MLATWGHFAYKCQRVPISLAPVSDEGVRREAIHGLSCVVSGFVGVVYLQRATYQPVTHYAGLLDMLVSGVLGKHRGASASPLHVQWLSCVVGQQPGPPTQKTAVIL